MDTGEEFYLKRISVGLLDLRGETTTYTTEEEIVLSEHTQSQISQAVNATLKSKQDSLLKIEDTKIAILVSAEDP